MSLGDKAIYNAVLPMHDGGAYVQDFSLSCYQGSRHVQAPGA